MSLPYSKRNTTGITKRKIPQSAQGEEKRQQKTDDDKTKID